MTSKEEKSKLPAPQDLITEENVAKVLQTDKGQAATLKSWKIADFTKRGDNFASFVTSVSVQYSLADQNDLNVSYVVKLNPCRKFEGYPDHTYVLFEKEGNFYQEILPELNAQLIAAGHKPLSLPRCLLVSLTEDKEQIYFEDLREKGFKMFDRRKGMDTDHADLVLKELARLHASSYLLGDKFPRDTWNTQFEYLAKDLITLDEQTTKLTLPFLESTITQSIGMLEKIGGYEMVIKWLEQMKPDLEHLVTTFMQTEKFTSICHGDCWNNNTLFRYDDQGKPVEVKLLDLQVCRIASLSVDLNYMLFTSLTGEVRKPNIERFMSVYHSSYKSVLEGGNKPMYFTEEELVKEYRDKNKLGVYFAMSTTPVFLMEPEEIPDMSDPDINIEDAIEDITATTLANLDKNPLLKPRFLSSFDELIETGLISNVYK